MTKEKKTAYIREPGLCVIRDDDHDWGGAGEVELKEPTTDLKIKSKIETVKDEPMNWPFR